MKTIYAWAIVSKDEPVERLMDLEVYITKKAALMNRNSIEKVIKIKIKEA